MSGKIIARNLAEIKMQHVPIRPPMSLGDQRRKLAMLKWAAQDSLSFGDMVLLEKRGAVFNFDSSAAVRGRWSERN